MRNMKLLIVAITIIFAQTTVAQERRNYRDIAFDYLLQNINTIDARPWSVKAANYDKMSNGGYLVKLTLSRTLTRQEERLVNNQVQAYGATFNVGVRNATVNIDFEDVESYFVFVDRYGVPSKYMEASTNHEFYSWGGNVWLFMNKHKETFGNKDLTYFSNIACFSNEGETLWSGRDMKIYSYAFSGKTLYMVGTLWNNGSSIIRSIDIKTLEYKDKVGNSGIIPCGANFSEGGVRITQIAGNGHFSYIMFPYTANDRQFQIDLVLKNYNLSKTSDQIALGVRYLTGDVVDKDERKAVELFEKAANQNSDVGMLKLAECFKDGIGVNQDNIKAISLYEKAANMDNIDAMIMLSDMYAKGDGVEKNMSKTLYWKEKLAFKGNLNAQKYVLTNQSVKYEKVDITADEALKIARENYKRENYSWAQYCIERAVSLGSKAAMLDYGKWLYFGVGFAKDNDKAIELLSKLGEEDNNVDAQMALAQIYYENKGVPHDIKKQIYWLTKAAENDNVDALVTLGYYYRYSYEIKKNKKAAFTFYEKAAHQGNQDAIREIVYSYALGEGTKKDKHSALMWFGKMNDVDKQLTVANNFFTGHGVKKKFDIAAMMYKELSDKGNIKATKALALCYLDGLGVDKDIYLAYELAMTVRGSAKYDGEDGDIYYIEAKYFEKKHPRYIGIIDSYRRAIKYGCSRAVKDFARYQRKYGLRLDLNGETY